MEGNVRELKNIVERGFYLSSGAFIDSLEMLLTETKPWRHATITTAKPSGDLEKNIEYAFFSIKAMP